MIAPTATFSAVRRQQQETHKWHRHDQQTTGASGDVTPLKTSSHLVDLHVGCCPDPNIHFSAHFLEVGCCRHLWWHITAIAHVTCRARLAADVFVFVIVIGQNQFFFKFPNSIYIRSKQTNSKKVPVLHWGCSFSGSEWLREVASIIIHIAHP